jgi:hypothetical protein
MINGVNIKSIISNSPPSMVEEDKKPSPTLPLPLCSAHNSGCHTFSFMLYFRGSMKGKEAKNEKISI